MRYNYKILSCNLIMVYYNSLAIKANLGNCRLEKQKKLDAESNDETYISLTELISKSMS